MMITHDRAYSGNRAFGRDIRRAWYALAIFSIFVGIGLAIRPLLPVDETRYLAVAWEMWRTGDYLIPHLNGEVYAQKPPLLFWLINLVWLLTGPNELAARLVAPFFAGLSIVLTVTMARHLWPERHDAGARSAFILSTFGAFLVFGSITTFDALLTSTVLISLTGLLLAYRGYTFPGWLIFGAGIGFGVLSKGPVILVHTMPVALLMPLWAPPKSRPSLKSWYAGIALAMGFAAIISAMWLVPAMASGGPEYRDAILWRQSAGRMVNSFAHQRPWWFFAAMAPVMLWPWGWWMPLWRAMRQARLSLDPMERFCIIWIGAAFIFFSAISGKQPQYMLPEMPAIALLMGRTTPLSGQPYGWMIVPILPVAILWLLVLALGMGIVEIPKFPSPGIEMALPRTGLVIATVSLLIFGGLAMGYHWRTVGVLSPLLIIIVLTAAARPIDQLYNGKYIAVMLRQGEKYGLAFLGHDYQNEFNFPARLTTTVAQLGYKSQLLSWIEKHPGGVIFGDETELFPNWRPVLKRIYRGKPYLVWTVPLSASEAPLESAGTDGKWQ